MWPLGCESYLADMYILSLHLSSQLPSVLPINVMFIESFLLEQQNLKT